MAPSRVKALLDNGHLWNSLGMAEYFFDLYSRPDFQERYERERVRFIRNSRRSSPPWRDQGPARLPDPANFALVDLPNGLSAEDLVCRLLVRRGSTPGPATTSGLDPGEFLRIAARNRPEQLHHHSLRRLIRLSIPPRKPRTDSVIRSGGFLTTDNTDLHG